jgi:hypothetical protein
MSDSENIALWKKKSEIDYTSLFVPLWLSLDAWMRDRYTEKSDRKRLELFKRGEHKISNDFFTLLFDNNDARAKAFQGNLAELHKALENAKISYDNDRDKYISFSCVRVDQNGGELQYINLLKEERQQNKVELVEGLWVDDDKSKLFRGFMEILYQIRCALFHGDLKPNEANERVIKQLYLITVEIMKRV